jgi:hypothetical protein
LPTPRNGYFIGSTRVPSVTTVLSTLGWGSENLLTWANNLGLDGKKHTEERQKAADVGTCAHDMIDCYLHKRRMDSDPYTPDVIEAARPAFNAYLSWAKDHRVEVLASEFPLVSSAHRYGGTPDALVRINRTETVLLDFKTSKWLFAKHVIQVVAYLDLISECHNKYLDKAIVLRVGKDGVFRALTVEGESIEQGRQAFYHLLQLYKLKGPLEKLTRMAAEPEPKSRIALPSLEIPA